MRAAKQRNHLNEICGVLYYGNGYFFQCLEGIKTKVEQLFRNILKDKRHSNVLKLSYETVELQSFKEWSMKFTGLEPEFEASLNGFIKKHEWNYFNPFLLDALILEDFIYILLKEEDRIIRSQDQTSIEFNFSNQSLLLKDENAFIIILIIILALGYFLCMFLLKPKTTISYHPDSIYLLQNSSRKLMFLND